MSSVRRKLFKEGSNTWTTETIGEKQNNSKVESGSTELVQYSVVNEGDVVFKGKLGENPAGLKTPQENLFRRGAPSFGKVIKMALFKSLQFMHFKVEKFTSNY